MLNPLDISGEPFVYKDSSWIMRSHTLEGIYSISQKIILRGDKVYNIFTRICIFIFIVVFYLFRYTVR